MPDPVGFRLTDDQRQLRDWLHGFADSEIRPAAEEWDEREEFPWPLLERAAELGIYGEDFFAEGLVHDPIGLTWAVALEGLWGDGGIGMALTDSAPR